jgi:hypothetical protein
MIDAFSLLAGLRPNPDLSKLPIIRSGPNVMTSAKPVMSNLLIIHRLLGVIHRFGTLPSKRNMSIQGLEPALHPPIILRIP